MFDISGVNQIAVDLTAKIRAHTNVWKSRDDVNFSAAVPPVIFDAKSARRHPTQLGVVVEVEGVVKLRPNQFNRFRRNSKRIITPWAQFYKTFYVRNS